MINVLEGSTWPVRIAAGSAVSRCMEAFPDITRPQLGKLTEVLLPLLADKTWSVREEAAITLGVMVKVFGLESCPSVLDAAVKGLGSVRSQQDDFDKYGSADAEDLKRKHDNDVVLHTDQVLPSAPLPTHPCWNAMHAAPMCMPPLPHALVCFSFCSFRK